MPTFFYKALDKSGTEINGILEANSEKAVLDRLKNMGYYPVEIRGNKSSKAEKKNKMTKKRLSLMFLLLFLLGLYSAVPHFLAMRKLSLPLDECFLGSLGFFSMKILYGLVAWSISRDKLSRQIIFAVLIGIALWFLFRDVFTPGFFLVILILFNIIRRVGRMIGMEEDAKKEEENKKGVESE